MIKESKAFFLLLYHYITKKKKKKKKMLFLFVCLFVFLSCFDIQTVEALHLGTLMAAHGYFFPISDHVLTLKDDGTFYRFQVSVFEMFLTCAKG